MELIDFYTKNKRTFNNKKLLNVYVCGPTVYNHAHIGNVRPIIVFDVLNRISNLNYVHNITDIDDKIIQRAIELDVSEKEISKKYEEAYFNLMDDLNIIKPTVMPRVTDNIEGMINFIDSLIEKGFAYESNGSVYFSVKKLENYGLFANLQLDTFIDEEISEEKRNNKDFAIWKKTNNGIKFDSKWGKGRPGWHTECSFFINKYFSDKGIDLHGGGIDLKFPHHVNEMAQYEAYHGVKAKNLWLYVGHLTMNDEKMSKSSGNVIYAKDFINQHGYDVLKHLILSIDYLKPISINDNSIKNSINAMKKIKNSLIKTMINFPEDIIIKPEPTEKSLFYLQANLNTSAVFTNIFKFVNVLNKTKEKEQRRKVFNNILGDLSLLGIEYKINFKEIKNEIMKSKKEKKYDVLDKIREEILIC